MSPDLHTHDDTAPTTGATATAAAPLRRLYLLRFAFAAVWAVSFALTSSALTPTSVALLLLYPLVDVAAAVVDLRSSGATRPRGPLQANVVLSLLTTVGLAVAVASGIPDVLRVWGAWAITAGVVQVIVATRRRRLGGQAALVLSGGISVLAGAAFVVMSSTPGASLTGLAGYAALGGLFFLVSAFRIRAAR